MLAPVHFSDLKHMARSPAHYRHATDHGVEETRGMRIGTVVHAIVLGDAFHIWDNPRRGKAWQEFKADFGNRTIVTTPEHDEARAIADAIHADPVASELLAGERQTEVSLEWEYLGRACAGRLDLVKPDLIADLKVTTSAELDKFGTHAFRMGYHAQLAWYLNALGRPLTSPAHIIAVENKPPYAVTVRQLTEHALDYGLRQCRLWMERLLACEADESWPGYAQEIVPLDVPAWADDQTLVIDGEEVEL